MNNIKFFNVDTVVQNIVEEPMNNSLMFTGLAAIAESPGQSMSYLRQARESYGAGPFVKRSDMQQYNYIKNVLKLDEFYGEYTSPRAGVSSIDFIGPGGIQFDIVKTGKSTKVSTETRTIEQNKSIQYGNEISKWIDTHEPDIGKKNEMGATYKVTLSDGKVVAVTIAKPKKGGQGSGRSSGKGRSKPDYIYIEPGKGSGQFSNEEIVNSAKDTIQEWNYRAPRRGGEVFGGNLE